MDSTGSPHSQLRSEETKDEMLEVEEKGADALEENVEQHDRVAQLHAPEVNENVDSEDSAMEESSQDESDDCNKMETAENAEEEPLYALVREEPLYVPAEEELLHGPAIVDAPVTASKVKPTTMRP